MGLAGVAAVAVTLVLFPECRGGPYSALDPDLTSILLTEFTEAQPLGRWLMITLGGTAGLVVLPFAGLIGAIGLAWSNRDGRRVDWLVIAGFSIMLVLVMVVQVRGLRLAILPALPVGASLIAGAWSALRSRPGLVPAARLAGTIFLFAGVLHVLGVFLLRPGADEKPERATAYAECIAPESMKHLASLPEGRIVSYIFIGPTLLMWTPHAIVSAGYHRGEQGMRDALAFVSTDETAALRIARERDLDYLVFCKDVPLNSGLHGLPAFQGITDTGVRWSWLRALSEPDEPVQIYAIDTTAN
jgi:hypothetical protein